jgi:hypothetical protein
MFALKNLIFTSYNFLESYPRWEKKKGERNESLWDIYTICYVMWHEPHVMLQNKKWGGKIATSYLKSATPVGGGRQLCRRSQGWLAQARADQVGPKARLLRRAANPRHLKRAASAGGHLPGLSPVA